MDTAIQSRAGLYQWARLRGVAPVPDQSDVARGRLALEQAIRKLEGESASRTQFGYPRYDGSTE
jgi:hypothetical protein